MIHDTTTTTPASSSAAAAATQQAAPASFSPTAQKPSITATTTSLKNNYNNINICSPVSGHSLSEGRFSHITTASSSEEDISSVSISPAQITMTLFLGWLEVGGRLKSSRQHLLESFFIVMPPATASSSPSNAVGNHSRFIPTFQE